ncbi:MAG: uracil-DNA glycosylase [Candidatus Competibacterales bacterium]
MSEDTSITTLAKAPFPPLPPTWQVALGDEVQRPYFADLQAFVAAERRQHRVFPAPEDVFAALEQTPLSRVKVVILGQDPYHGPGQAHGLSFSVRPGVEQPPSLVNIFQELEADLGIPPPRHGYLLPWAQRGVLLLNAVLTVRAHKANSHQGRGWETFTDAILQAVAAQPKRVVFVLWGNYARKKRPLVAASHHAVVESAHPSPLSANRGFFGSHPFSKIDQLLGEAGRTTVDWSLPTN